MDLLNNPLALVLIVLAVVLVAVGLILYFLVFRGKVKKTLADNKVKNEKAQAKKAEAQSVVGDVFKEKQESEVVKTVSKEETKMLNKQVNDLINESKQHATTARMYQAARDEGPKPKPAKSQSEKADEFKKKVIKLEPEENSYEATTQFIQEITKRRGDN